MRITISNQNDVTLMMFNVPCMDENHRVLEQMKNMIYNQLGAHRLHECDGLNCTLWMPITLMERDSTGQHDGYFCSDCHQGLKDFDESFKPGAEYQKSGAEYEPSGSKYNAIEDMDAPPG